MAIETGGARSSRTGDSGECPPAAEAVRERPAALAVRSGSGGPCRTMPARCGCAVCQLCIGETDGYLGSADLELLLPVNAARRQAALEWLLASRGQVPARSAHPRRVAAGASRTGPTTTRPLQPSRTTWRRGARQEGEEAGSAPLRTSPGTALGDQRQRQRLSISTEQRWNCPERPRPRHRRGKRRRPSAWRCRMTRDTPRAPPHRRTRLVRVLRLRMAHRRVDLSARHFT